MSDLITRARALQNLNNLTPTSAEGTLLDNLVSAVSRAVEAYCRRTFDEQSFDELYDGGPAEELLLRHYPVLRVERVAHTPSPVLRITNTAAGNQRATVRVTDTGLVLTRVASGTTTMNSRAFADYVTLSALAAAVTALANGWSAAVVSGTDGARASADLRALQGAFNAKDTDAELRLHIDELIAFDVDAERGCLRRCDGWLGGPGSWRVIYDAGFAAVPDDVQEACAEWVAALFWQTKRDPGLAHENIPNLVARAPLGDVPATVKVLLRPYRCVRI
jgi:hypothetical protein